MLQVMNISLEHLHSGLEIVSNNPVVFDQEGPTTFVVWSFQPFECKWFIAGQGTTFIKSYESSYAPSVPDTHKTIQLKIAKNQSRQAPALAYESFHLTSGMDAQQPAGSSVAAQSNALQTMAA